MNVLLRVVKSLHEKIEVVAVYFVKNAVSCSSVGIGTGYWLDGPAIESRWGREFSAPVQTGPGAHSASCTMGTGSFSGVENGRGVTLTPHPLLVSRSRNSVALYLYSP
jgi:hypothetical protein